MSDEPTARQIASTRVFDGRVFAVDSDRVRLPNQREVTVDVVRHVPSVVLLPMPDRDHVILIRQYRYAVDKWLWETPAGSIDEGETPEEAARRECHEEIGLVPQQLTLLGRFLPTPGYCDEEMHVFLVESLVQPEEEAETDLDEMIRPHTVTLEEAKAMVARGEITDMKSAMALMLV